MNDRSFGDPQLRSVEARLAAAAPQVSSIEQQQLLYQCAFAAGQQASRRSLRRWKAAAAALVVLFLGLSVPVARDRWLLVETKSDPSTPKEVTPQRLLAQLEMPVAARQSASVDLDAWQMQQPDSVSLEFDQFRQTDPHLRSLAVGTLTRKFLEP